jgi:hypothetical protein
MEEKMVLGKVTPPISITGSIQVGLRPLVTPPTTLCRVVSGRTWLLMPLQDWLKYVASRNVGGVLPAPMLGKDTATHIHVTDEDSLDGFLEPVRIARRLGLSRAVHNDCAAHGCVIVRFSIPDPSRATFPPRNPSASQQGLTTGDAREWLIPNIPLDRLMDVLYIGISPIGDPFWYNMSLTDK